MCGHIQCRDRPAGTEQFEPQRKKKNFNNCFLSPFHFPVTGPSYYIKCLITLSLPQSLEVVNCGY